MQPSLLDQKPSVRFSPDQQERHRARVEKAIAKNRDAASRRWGEPSERSGAHGMFEGGLDDEANWEAYQDLPE